MIFICDVQATPSPFVANSGGQPTAISWLIDFDQRNCRPEFFRAKWNCCEEINASFTWRSFCRQVLKISDCEFGLRCAYKRIESVRIRTYDLTQNVLPKTKFRRDLACKMPRRKLPQVHKNPMKCGLF
jgi:hypothetical protein